MTEVVYERAKFTHRVFAFMVDLLFMLVTALALVLASREIVGRTPFYQKAAKDMNDIQLASHLFFEEINGDTTILCDHYKPESEDDCEVYNVELDKALKEFYTDADFFNQEDPNSGIALYIKQRLDTGYFIYTDDSHTDVAPKSDVLASTLYKTYSKLMKQDALTYMSKVGSYIDATKTINLSFIFLILLVPIVISVTIFEYIIPLFFKRGRKTLGKFFFKLGVVDSQGLSPSLLRFTFRFLLFLIIETILSIVTFTIPVIVSISMYFFSKSNQSFHDYVTGTYVVSCENARIFMNKEEYIAAHKEAEEFELKKEIIDLNKN